MSREIYVFADWEVFEKPTLATWDKVAPISLKKYIFRRKLDTLQRVQPVAGTKKMTGFTGLIRIYRIT
jgi:hypothetical protein